MFREPARPLAAQDVGEVADTLVQALGRETREDPDPIQFLTRYLKRLRVHKLHPTGPSPSRRAIERGEVDQVVSEFRAFLLNAPAEEENELPVIELE